MADPVLELADELYALPPGDFTAARDARARAHKGTDLAVALKALRKPSTAAWVVNLLVRREAAQVDQVLSVGSALREAQAGMSADQLRALTRQRRQLTAAVTQQARSLAAEAGVRVTQAVADQVEATLTAAVLDERCGAAVRSGLLVGPLASTGVDEVDVAAALALPAALGHAAAPREAAPTPRPELRVVPDPEADAKALASAQERLESAEEALAAATGEHEQAQAHVQELEARSMQLQADLDELRRRVAETEARAEQVDDELDDAEDARGEAAGALEVARAERDAAAAARDRLRPARAR